MCLVAFQYSFCSYSTCFKMSALRFCFTFQYSFCSYSTKIDAGMGKLNTCFNTASVLIQLTLGRFRENKNNVSIQLLFLFNIPWRKCWVYFGFVSIQLLFLFNTKKTNYLILGNKFQYSFCSYSTRLGKAGKINISVSIQLLFLFNLNDSLFRSSRRSFNTASVLIQPLMLKILIILKSFNTASVLIQPKFFITK